MITTSSTLSVYGDCYSVHYAGLPSPQVIPEKDYVHVYVRSVEKPETKGYGLQEDQVRIIVPYKGDPNNKNAEVSITVNVRDLRLAIDNACHVHESPTNGHRIL
jgi:hypothetical protein